MSEEQPPAAEPASAEPEAPKVEAKPESPTGSLREQLLQLVPDDMKSQAADIIRGLLDHAPASTPPAKEEEVSAVVKKRYDHAPFRPRVTREETPRPSSNYGSISD